MAKSVQVKWKTGLAKGYTDVFPLDEFKDAVVGAERVHLVRGRHGGHIKRGADSLLLAPLRKWTIPRSLSSTDAMTCCLGSWS